MSPKYVMYVLESKYYRFFNQSESYMARSILAGIYISLGALFMNFLKIQGMPPMVYGLGFSLGLLSVILADGELFTGNCLMTLAVFNNKIESTKGALTICLIGNLLGAALIFSIVYSSSLDTSALVDIAVQKNSVDSWTLFVKSILCNVLIVLAVWMASYKETSMYSTDKFIAILLPVIAFIVCGFEHSIADMFIFPFAVFANKISIEGALIDILIVIIGNYIGGKIIAVFLFIASREDTDE